MLSFARVILRLTNILNWVAGLLILALAAAMFFAPEFWLVMLNEDYSGDREKGAMAMHWYQITALLCVPVVPVAHVILTKLIKMIDSVAEGSSFATDNVARLRHIAWALLAINVIDLGFGAISTWASAESGGYFGWSLSLTGWFAVLLLFILAQVFQESVEMREDLEGTV